MAYRIQEVAQKCHLSTYSIRYYHDHGMLPFVQRDAHNNRVFHDIDLEWLNLIKCLRQTGMPLKRIRHYLDLVQQGDTTIPERYAIMQAQQAQAQQELATTQAHLAIITHKVDHYHDILATGQPDSFVPQDLPTTKSVSR
ncbi:MerR family transcriptional regulator [Levilactobacillus suantsaii]|uniref:MerR family transcriptional regulator n=1 Tax=Levilactobacillus suantsaii TaxID=2292255 RepID=A0A4Q0VJD3_9LACO|nr:MerR family transcriptional regulator [Levilactobacillus suantsaii]QMU08714.1 MerR family transcriptional regulator [Levilactobacillus suantsaii]RXI78889.1 MerR family transcriptional regulator [Levilactobacillus suantsaii]